MYYMDHKIANVIPFKHDSIYDQDCLMYHIRVQVTGVKKKSTNVKLLTRN